jgi:hypothetical protein
MSAGYSQLAFGAWPQSAPVYPAQPNPEVLYIDPVNGKDFNNPSGSQARPLRTFDELSKRLVGFTNAVDVHLRNATYVLPTGGVFLKSRMLNGRIRMFADEAWDPTVYSVVLTGPALAGSTKVSVVVAGGEDFPTNSLIGLTIEVTHLGVKQLRTIRNNTVDEGGNETIVPVWGFDAISDGDVVRVLGNNALIVTPDSESADSYVFAADSPAYQPFYNEFDGGSIAAPGLQLEGVAFDGATFGFGLAFGALPVWLYGVQLPGDIAIEGTATTLNIGDGFQGTRPEIQGWGLGTTNALAAGGFFERCKISGFIASKADFGVIGVGTQMQLLGGRFTRILDGVQSGSRLFTPPGFPFDQTVPVLLDSSGGASVALRMDGASDIIVELTNADIHGGGAGIEVAQGGTLVLDSTVTGSTDAGDAVFLDYGQGRIILRGSPQFGDAVATDWDVAGSGGAVNKSFFSGAGQALLSATDAGVIVQVS